MKTRLAIAFGIFLLFCVLLHFISEAPLRVKVAGDLSLLVGILLPQLFFEWRKPAWRFRVAVAFATLAFAVYTALMAFVVLKFDPFSDLYFGFVASMGIIFGAVFIWSFRVTLEKIVPEKG